jgi:hypothetical protein
MRRKLYQSLRRGGVSERDRPISDDRRRPVPLYTRTRQTTSNTPQIILIGTGIHSIPIDKRAR